MNQKVLLFEELKQRANLFYKNDRVNRGLKLSHYKTVSAGKNVVNFAYKLM